MVDLCPRPPPRRPVKTFASSVPGRRGAPTATTDACTAVLCCSGGVAYLSVWICQPSPVLTLPPSYFASRRFHRIIVRGVLAAAALPGACVGLKFAVSCTFRVACCSQRSHPHHTSLTHTSRPLNLVSSVSAAAFCCRAARLYVPGTFLLLTWCLWW